MPLLPGLDYQLTNPIVGPIAINNNQGTPMVLVGYPWAFAQNVVFEYSLVRGMITEVSRILVSTNGTTISWSNDATNQAGTGVTFMVMLSGANVEIQYMSDNSGSSGNFWYTQRTL